MNPMLNIAIRAARAAAKIIVQQIDHVQSLPVARKSRNDYVTQVDRHAEQAIIETVLKSYPDHAILAEESGRQGDSPFVWIIDPLDGTTNYLHGFPQFAISIAIQHRDKLEQALVYDPLRQELFTASRGQGALLNNKRIRVSQQKKMQDALLGTGFPFRQPDDLPEYLDTFKAFFPLATDIRRAGAATLDLAYVACGRLDGFWEIGLKPWDMAAGALLIGEAGGLVSDLNCADAYLENGDILAANSHLHGAMIKTLASARQQKSARDAT